MRDVSWPMAPVPFFDGGESQRDRLGLPVPVLVRLDAAWIWKKQLRRDSRCDIGGDVDKPIAKVCLLDGWGRFLVGFDCSADEAFWSCRVEWLPQVPVSSIRVELLSRGPLRLKPVEGVGRIDDDL